MSNNNEGAIPEPEMQRIYKDAEDYLEVEKSKGLPAKDWVRVGGAFCAGKISEYNRKLTESQGPAPVKETFSLVCQFPGMPSVTFGFDETFSGRIGDGRLKCFVRRDAMGVIAAIGDSYTGETLFQLLITR